MGITAMSRDDAIGRVRQHFQSGGFLADLDRRVSFPTESQSGKQAVALRAYHREHRYRERMYPTPFPGEYWNWGKG